MTYRFPIYLVLITFLTACSGPAYYQQAISGHWKLIHSRQDIQSLLNNPATSPELAANLKTASQIKSFAQSTLYLPANGSYSSYVEVDGDALVWNVVATKEFSLQAKKWCFLVAGCVPYRGFFKQQKAKASAARLHNRGMDVVVSPAVAYSSLGWFRDPLLSTMFSGSDIRLATYVFHELAHQRLYIKNHGSFNESYASFIEQAGLQVWLEFNQRQDELQTWQQLQTVSKDFTNLIGEIRKQLYDLYHTNKTETVKRQQKATIFRLLASSYEILVTERWHDKRYYATWFEDPPNNAKLALYDTYEGSNCAFQGLLDQAKGDLRQFHRLAEQKSKLPYKQREKWLKQKCVSIAPQGNL